MNIYTVTYLIYIGKPDVLFMTIANIIIGTAVLPQCLSSAVRCSAPTPTTQEQGNRARRSSTRQRSNNHCSCFNTNSNNNNNNNSSNNNTNCNNNKNSKPCAARRRRTRSGTSGRSCHWDRSTWIALDLAQGHRQCRT